MYADRVWRQVGFVRDHDVGNPGYFLGKFLYPVGGSCPSVVVKDNRTVGNLVVQVREGSEPFVSADVMHDNFPPFVRQYLGFFPDGSDVCLCKPL